MLEEVEPLGLETVELRDPIELFLLKREVVLQRGELRRDAADLLLEGADLPLEGADLRRELRLPGLGGRDLRLKRRERVARARLGARAPREGDDESEEEA